MKFQPRHGTPDSNGFLMELVGSLKKLRNGDSFNKSFTVNAL